MKSVVFGFLPHVCPAQGGVKGGGILQTPEFFCDAENFFEVVCSFCRTEYPVYFKDQFLTFPYTGLFYRL